MRRLILPLLLAGLLGCGSPSSSGPPHPEPTAGPTVEDARAFAASQPRYLRPVKGSAVPTGLADVRSATCGACHVEIYAEWAVSTHARAWLDDPQFMEELAKSKEQGVDWMCMNCHTPFEAQLPTLVAGYRDGAKDQPILVKNPLFDPIMQKDAIGCATCHVRDGVVIGPWGDTQAPHAVARGEELLTPAVCTQCHQASATFEELNLACTFDTGGEYERGPYDGEGQTCQSCHMPAVTRPLMAGLPARVTRRHWFGGSLIPKQPAFEAELAPLRDIYPDGLVADWQDLPSTLTAGSTARLTARYTNANAGHLLPTGDPERFVLVTATVTGADGVELARAEHRIGAVYTWWPKVKKESDNRLKPRESRTLDLEFVVPGSGPVNVHLVASKWRLNAENIDFHDLADRAVAGYTFLSTTRPVVVH